MASRSGRNSPDEQGQNAVDDSDIIRNVDSRRELQLRRVSFPKNDTDLVTGYMEPDNPRRLALNVNKEDLLEAYLDSCERHNTDPIERVVEQIGGFNLDHNPIDKLDLSGIKLTNSGCESLETIFMRVQFDYLDLTDCDLSVDTACVLFDILEYYESTSHLNVSKNYDIGLRGWQACARYLKASNTLEELEIQDVRLTEIEADYLFKPITSNRYLQTLKLENCNLNVNVLRYLANSLTHNTYLKELYLADNQLGVYEATMIGTLLEHNKTLQLLDLSNNHIQNIGVNNIVSGLCHQQRMGSLEVLILWNNYLTTTCATYISQLLKAYPVLTILNIGCNNLYDTFMLNIKDGLAQNKNLLRLGLQCTKLSCAATENIADALRTNNTLERIDLRGNNISVGGLRHLTDALDTNRTLSRIDLNDATTSAEIDEYEQLIKAINTKCTQNRDREPSRPVGTAQVFIPRTTSRKISLTCQTLTHESMFMYSPPSFLAEPKRATGKLRSPAPSPIPSPIPSPVSSPTPLVTKSRFSVSRVCETNSPITQSQSRFTVTVIEPPKSVTSNSGAVTYGFAYDKNKAAAANSHSTPQYAQGDAVDGADPSNNICDRASDTNALNGCSSTDDRYHKRDDDTIKSSSPIVEPSCCVVSDNRAVPIEKPLSSLDKLLSLFQAPTHLFARYNNSDNSTSSWKDSIIKPKTDSPPKPCDTTNNGKSSPFANTNMTSAKQNTNDIQNTIEPGDKSAKENVSPEHTLQAKTVNNQCALDNFNNSTTSKTKEFSLSQHGSSSEESDSGNAAFESSVTTDSGVSDESYDKSDLSCSTAKPQIPCSSESDLTNNNSWKRDEKVDSEPDENNEDITIWKPENN